MTQPQSTNDRLGDALETAGAPLRMIKRARRGYYSDFQSDSTAPKADLVIELNDLGLTALAQRVTNGEFNDTVPEARAWLTSAEGFKTLRAIFPAISKQQWKDIIGT